MTRSNRFPIQKTALAREWRWHKPDISVLRVQRTESK
jgi:hypothetical protein